MKTFRQTRDVLRLSTQFHQQLSDLYGRLSHVADKQRVKLLLDYLSRHEQALTSCLDGYEARIPRATLDTWLQYMPNDQPLGDVDLSSLGPDMTVREVTELAFDFDDALMSFYRNLARESESADVRVLFESLLQLEEHEQIALRRENFAV